jgi:hypothetical protein
VALSVLLASGCASSQVASPPAQAQQSVHQLVGGCSGTRVSEAEPPVWAQGGWNGHVKGTPWGVPWAIGTSSDAIAYLFAGQLVAGNSPRPDGSNNKILWVVKDAQWGFTVSGSPLGTSQSVVRVAGGPSIVDVPSAGCWTFRLSRNSDKKLLSTINLEVLPESPLPS